MMISNTTLFQDLLLSCEQGEITSEQMMTILNSNMPDKKNFYQEVQMTQAFVDCHKDISYAEASVQLHSHLFFEILYCKSGNLQYLLGTTRFRIQPGDIIFIPPGISHRPIFPQK